MVAPARNVRLHTTSTTSDLRSEQVDQSLIANGAGWEAAVKNVRKLKSHILFLCQPTDRVLDAIDLQKRTDRGV